MPRFLASLPFALILFGCSGSEGSAAARAADAATLQPASSAAPAKGKADSLLAKADAGRILGSAKAVVWMIIISDFQCPYCKRWHDETWAAVRKEYVDTGKLRVAYVNLPLNMHRNALPAAQVAMCASVQDKFWPVQDALFRAQGDWEDAADPQPKFEALAREAGVNVDELRSCVVTGATRPLIQADTERAASAGATSTPMFFIGGRPLLGAQPLSVFREAIDAALAAPPAGK
jgi:protein-disulfide isomerase